MDKKMGLSRRSASAKASGPQGHQSTGLSLCCNRYGLVQPFRWLAISAPFITCSVGRERGLRECWLNTPAFDFAWSRFSRAVALPPTSSLSDDLGRPVMNETTSTRHPVGQHIHVGPGAAQQSGGAPRAVRGVLTHLHLTKASFRLDAWAAGRVCALSGWQLQGLLLNLAAMRLGRQALRGTPAFLAPGRSRCHPGHLLARHNPVGWRRQSLSRRSGRGI